MILYESMLYVEVMYHFIEQVDFKISSKLIQASKGKNLVQKMHFIKYFK